MCKVAGNKKVEITFDEQELIRFFRAIVQAKIRSTLPEEEKVDFRTLTAVHEKNGPWTFIWQEVDRKEKDSNGE